MSPYSSENGFGRTSWKVNGVIENKLLALVKCEKFDTRGTKFSAKAYLNVL